MTTLQPSIDALLGEFFARRSARLSGLRLRRLADVADRLSECLEREGPALISPEDRLLLELEREFCPYCAFHLSMQAPQLLPVLRCFVTDAWLPGDPQDRRVQLQTVAALVEFLEAERLIDSRRLLLPLLQLQVAIDDAKGTLL